MDNGKKLSPDEKKKKLEIETEIPNPTVPNRAWTEMKLHGVTLEDKLRTDSKIRSEKE